MGAQKGFNGENFFLKKYEKFLLELPSESEKLKYFDKGLWKQIALKNCM